MPKREDLSGQIIYNWKINYSTENRKYNCTCLICNRDFEVLGHKIKAGKSKSCRDCANKIKDTGREKLEGTQINKWTVLEYLGDSKYKCKCECGNIEEQQAYYLKNGVSKYCRECANKAKSEAKREKLEGMKFGELTPIKYLGDSKYLCECSCSNTHITTAHLLKTGVSTRCTDCSNTLRRSKYRETMFSRYRDIASSKINNPRDEWQLNLLNSKEDLKLYIADIEKELGRLPTSVELARDLGVSIHILLTYTREYNINLYKDSVSNSEFELRSIIESTGIEARYNDKTVIYPYELDIYIPSKEIAIEFNGDYWHSDLFKDKEYHQNKTIDCINKGIQLIHIFEYEWRNKETKQKIINLLYNILDTYDHNIIYARTCEIKEVSVEDSKEFLNKNHLQGYSHASIRLGLYNNNELISIMTFGKPRFNPNYEYEIVRLAHRNNIKVIGGTAKLFKHFIKNYDPASVITYCDISKFNGNVYNKLGFKIENKENFLTKPNYVWVNTSTDEVYKRYQTQKSNLIKNGLGSEEQTEDEIMKSHGFIKVYDSGNLKLIWKKEIN